MAGRVVTRGRRSVAHRRGTFRPARWELVFSVLLVATVAACTANAGEESGNVTTTVDSTAEQPEPEPALPVAADVRDEPTARSASDEDDSAVSDEVADGGVASYRFMESFDDDSGLDRFDLHVFHRNLDIHQFEGFSGGSWTGDHDESCGSPDTQRPLRLEPSDSQAERRTNSFYVCRDHVMTAMGDVDGYSIVAFSPAEVFDDVDSVSFEVNLTDLGTRQWWKVGVLSTSACPELDLRCMYSDIGSADLPFLGGSDRLIASWGGAAGVAGRHGMAIGDDQVESGVDPTPNDKATRHAVSLTDNADGTVTFEVAGFIGTASGSFPACPCRVVFYDHNYTPDKSETGFPIGHTWHWDSIIVT